jgi:2-methylcitrate dehydratase PrpD
LTARALPAAGGGRLVATRHVGSCRAARAQDLRPSKGSPQNPMTDEELEDKFMSLATRVLPQEQASKIAATVRDLENVKDLRDLTDLLVSPSS